MNDSLFEPNFNEEHNKKLKKEIIMYLSFIITILIIISIYTLVIYKKGIWVKKFEIKEIKNIASASLGNEDAKLKNNFNINYLNDIYITFENKNDNIKKITFKNIKIDSNNDISIHKFATNKKLFEENSLNLEKERTIDFKIPKNEQDIITSFRVKNNGIAQIKIDSNYEGKASLSLLKDKIQDINKYNYELEIDILITLKNDQILKGHLLIKNPETLDLNKEMNVFYIDPKNVKFGYKIKN